MFSCVTGVSVLLDIQIVRNLAEVFLKTLLHTITVTLRGQKSRAIIKTVHEETFAAVPFCVHDRPTEIFVTSQPKHLKVFDSGQETELADVARVDK